MNGQQAYALPSDFLQVIRLDYVTQGSGATARTQKILEITPNQRDSIVDTSGNPGFYFLQKNNIMLLPVPNSVLTLHLEYSYIVSDMVLDADTPDAPEHFHPYIAYLTARDCMVKDGRSLTSIQKQLDDFELLLKQIAVQRNADGPRMVVSTDQWEF